MPLDVDTSPVDIRVVLGSTTPPGRPHCAVDGAIERAAERRVSADLIDLGTLEIGFAGATPIADLDDDTASTVAALEATRAVRWAAPTSGPRRRSTSSSPRSPRPATLAPVEAIGEPLPLGAKAVRPTNHRR